MSSWKDLFAFNSKGQAGYEEFAKKPTNVRDRIYIFDVSMRAFRALAVFCFVISVTTLVLVAVLTAPPGNEGSPDVCALVDQCNGNGICDSRGECWCSFGLYAGVACEFTSSPGIVAVVAIALTFALFLLAVYKSHSFNVKLKECHKEHKQGLWDLDNVVTSAE